MKKEDLNFTIYCVGIMAERLGLDAREVYHLMQKGDIIMGYIVPCFDVLHSFSSEYITEECTDSPTNTLCRHTRMSINNTRLVLARC